MHTDISYSLGMYILSSPLLQKQICTHISLNSSYFNSKAFLYKRGIVYPIWYKSLLESQYELYKASL